MWVKAKKTKLNEYGVDVTTQRKLADDEHIMHMELADNPNFFISIRYDEQVKLFNNEQMDTLIVDATGNELDAVKLAEKESEILSSQDNEKLKHV